MARAERRTAFVERRDVFIDGFGAVDDELEFICEGDVFGERQLPALGAERDPVESATDGEGPAGFEVCLLANGVERVGQCGEVVDGGLAAGNYGEFGLSLGDLARERVGGEALYVVRNVVRVPCASGVAPRAVDGATERADEVSRPSGMRTFALKGVELFMDRKCHGICAVLWQSDFLKNEDGAKWMCCKCMQMFIDSLTRF
ncbi:MAG: hypothetical protein ACI8ZW_001685 [Yoonia sp.]